MIKSFITAVLLLALAPTSYADTLAQQEYQAALRDYEKEGGARLFAKRFLQIAERHPQDPAAVDALLWVVKHVRGRSDTTRALELLAEHQLKSKKLGGACKAIAGSNSLAAEQLLRAILKHSPYPSVQAEAGFYLAALLDAEAGLLQQLRDQPDLEPRVRRYYGQDYGEHLISLDSRELDKKREQAYEQLLKGFPDHEVDGTKLEQAARKMLFQIRHLSVGKVAPEIEGEDIRGEPLKLSDFRGKVVMLTFWGDW